MPLLQEDLIKLERSALGCAETAVQSQQHQCPFEGRGITIENLQFLQVESIHLGRSSLGGDFLGCQLDSDLDLVVVFGLSPLFFDIYGVSARTGRMREFHKRNKNADLRHLFASRHNGGGGDRTRVPRYFHASLYMRSRIISTLAN